MDMQALKAHYLWPAIMAVGAAVATYLSSGADFDIATLGKTAGGAAVAFFLTRFNPVAGKEQPYMTPKE